MRDYRDIYALFIIVGVALFFLISFIGIKGSSQEGFSPKWVRTKKNILLKKFRRTVKPYNDKFINTLSRIRRRWF